MTPSDLKAARLRLKLSQRQLADALGYADVMTISRMERGLVRIPKVVEMAIEALTPPKKRRRGTRS